MQNNSFFFSYFISLNYSLKKKKTLKEALYKERFINITKSESKFCFYYYYSTKEKPINLPA